MNTNKRIKLFAAVCGVYGATALCALQANANAVDDSVPARKVGYADLDIAKPAGAKALYRRIAVAAHQVCAFDSGRDLGVAARERACVEEAINTAVKHVNSAVLTELHAAKAIHLASN